MVMLKRPNIINKRIIYKRAKTGRVYDIKVTDSIQAILDLYTKGKKKNDYIFPIVVRDEDAEDLRRDIKYKMKLYNKRLNQLAKELEIETNLTSYVSRHSWATIANKSNVKIGIISDGLGHKDIKTTQTYLASTDTEELDKANKLITDL